MQIKKYKGTPESATRKAICEYLDILKAQGILDFWVNKNIPTFDPITKRFRSFGKYEREGIPDLSGILYASGIRLDIEVKAPHPKKSAHQLCSDEQKEFILNATKAGGVAFAASSIEEVKRHLEFPVRVIKQRLKENKNGQ